jgi:hypothetical protein
MSFAAVNGLTQGFRGRSASDAHQKREMLGLRLIHGWRHDGERGVAHSTAIQCEDREIGDGFHDCGVADWATDW